MFHSLLTVSLKRVCRHIFFLQTIVTAVQMLGERQIAYSVRAEPVVMCLKNYAHAQKLVGLRLFYHIMLLLVESSYKEMWPVAADEAKLCFCACEQFCWVCDLKCSCWSVAFCPLWSGRLSGTDPWDCWDASLPPRFLSSPELDWNLGLSYFYAPYYRSWWGMSSNHLACLSLP